MLQRLDNLMGDLSQFLEEQEQTPSTPPTSRSASPETIAFSSTYTLEAIESDRLNRLSRYILEKTEIDNISGYYIVLSYKYKTNLKMACEAVAHSGREFDKLLLKRRLSSLLMRILEDELIKYHDFKNELKNFVMEEISCLNLLTIKSEQMITEHYSECVLQLGFTKVQFFEMLFQLVHDSIDKSTKMIQPGHFSVQDYFIQIMSVTINYSQTMSNIRDKLEIPASEMNHEEYESFIIQLFKGSIRYIDSEAKRLHVPPTNFGEFMTLLKNEINLKRLAQGIELDPIKSEFTHITID